MIDIYKISGIIQFLLDNRPLYESIVHYFGSVTCNNGYGSDFITSNDQFAMYSICLSKKNGNLESVNISGNFKFSLLNLTQQLGEYRRVYNSYDDQIAYIFINNQWGYNFIVINDKNDLEQNENVREIEIIFTQAPKTDTERKDGSAGAEVG